MRFYTSIAPYYDNIFPLNQQQLKVVRGLLHPGDRILDVGCATGSLGVALADNGHFVHGIDLDPNLIALARQRASEQRCDVLFEKRNMLDVGDGYPEKPSQLVVTVGNTLVHLNRDDIKAYLRGVYGHLSPGGRFLTQIINYDRITKNSQSALPMIDNDVVTFVRKYDLAHLPDKVFFHTELFVKSTRETIENTIELTPLLAREQLSMLEGAGFVVSSTYGNFKKEPYSEDSYALVVVAEKSV